MAQSKGTLELELERRPDGKTDVDEMDGESTATCTPSPRVTAARQDPKRKGMGITTLVRALSFGNSHAYRLRKEREAQRLRNQRDAAEASARAAAIVGVGSTTPIKQTKRAASFNRDITRHRPRQASLPASSTSSDVVLTAAPDPIQSRIHPRGSSQAEVEKGFQFNFDPAPPTPLQPPSALTNPRNAAPSSRSSKTGLPQRTLGCVLESFTAETAVELSVDRGEIIVLLNDGAPIGWSWACSPAGAGLVPTDFVQFLDLPTGRTPAKKPQPQEQPQPQPQVQEQPHKQEQEQQLVRDDVEYDVPYPDKLLRMRLPSSPPASPVTLPTSDATSTGFEQATLNTTAPAPASTDLPSRSAAEVPVGAAPAPAPERSPLVAEHVAGFPAAVDSATAEVLWGPGTSPEEAQDESVAAGSPAVTKQRLAELLQDDIQEGPPSPVVSATSSDGPHTPSIDTTGILPSKEAAEGEAPNVMNQTPPVKPMTPVVSTPAL